MDDLVTRLAAGVQQREVRWPGNDGSDFVTDRGGATATMAEAANRIQKLEAALLWIAALGDGDLEDLIRLDAKKTIIDRLMARARDALGAAQ